MTAEDFARAALKALAYDPNEQQTMVLAALSRFVAAPQDAENRVFILNGYAGTGKTSLTGAVVRALDSFGRKSVLLAPTGRAAKVFGSFAGRRAYTIHRRIYRGAGPDNTFSTEIAENRLRNAVFIVDEASMIGSGNAAGSLLDDLIEHVYSGTGCRLILLGDTAQLPPVGSATSPAMNPEHLRSRGLKVSRAVMTMTVRQAARSGILYNATNLRRAMTLPALPPPSLRASGFRDVTLVPSEELLDYIAADYNADGMENTILITRSNSRAVRYNAGIRYHINMCDEELMAEERLMIAKNNYFWTKDTPGIDFIANGDMAVVERIYSTESRFGLRFADVCLRLPDRDTTVDCKIILDTLHSEHPALEPEKGTMLAEAVLAQASGGAHLSRTAAMKILRADPYAQALQVKYAYAVTCHKAQGGQWKNVYVDLTGMPPDADELSYYRWLYTAVTRATTNLNLISPIIGIR